jgi:hypothetical protein
MHVGVLYVAELQTCVGHQLPQRFRKSAVTSLRMLLGCLVGALVRLARFLSSKEKQQ